MTHAIQKFRNTKRCVILSALMLTGARTSNAQTSQSGAAMVVRGVAYDSLHKTPLRGAMISVDGTPHSTFTDSAGVFVFDGIVDRIDTKDVGIMKIDAFSLVDPYNAAVIDYHAGTLTAPVEFKPKSPCDVVIIWTKLGVP